VNGTAVAGTLWTQPYLTYLVAAGIAVARALGLVMITPAFTRLGITGLLRSCVAAVVAVPVVPKVVEALATTQLTSPIISGLIIKEMLVGAIVGLVFGIPFWAAETAGDLVDLQRGSTAAQLLDPLSLTASNITSTFLTITLLGLFFLMGGFATLLGGLYDSYGLWPAASFTPVLGTNSVAPLLHMLDQIMLASIVMVAPVVIGLLLADIGLGFLSRMAPQFHVFDMSLSIKNLLFTFLLAVYAAVLLPHMLSEIQGLSGSFDVLRKLVAETPP